MAGKRSTDIMSNRLVFHASRQVLLSGNEAIARGALEAGIQFCTGYPGTPSSEILENIAAVAKERGIYAEWSINEKVAVESAAAASLAGLRSLVTMKNAGMNVASDFLMHHNLSGIGSRGGGMVVVVCDDPGGHSSSDEQDTRWLARSADVPLLVPDSPQDARDLVKWAFEISETFRSYCILRSYTSLSHSYGVVKIDELPYPESRKATYDISETITPETPYIVALHEKAHMRSENTRELFETSGFNCYEGTERAELLIICCGSGSPCSRDAVDILGVEDVVGILKIDTVWPLPKRLVEEHMYRSCAQYVLVVEETDPFLELHVKEVVADSSKLAGKVRVLGRGSGHIPHCGELTPDSVIKALTSILRRKYTPRESGYIQKMENLGGNMLVNRDATWCPGCPHRASFWCLKSAFGQDGRECLAIGDVGCYTLDIWPAGYHVTKLVHGMGTGLGMGSGFGKLDGFGFDQPVVSVCGDSTFFHSSIPALINAIHNKANMVAIVLDNGATAMTGFQPHPGTDVNALGDSTPAVDIADFCRSLGCEVMVRDPFDVEETITCILKLLKNRGGVKVLVLRRMCELIRMRQVKLQPYRMRVDDERCKGQKCSYCTDVFACPGLTISGKTGKAKIVEGICAGCGLCVDVCPSKAIIREQNSGKNIQRPI